jgi:hypothetical protein
MRAKAKVIAEIGARSRKPTRVDVSSYPAARGLRPAYGMGAIGRAVAFAKGLPVSVRSDAIDISSRDVSAIFW